MDEEKRTNLGAESGLIEKGEEIGGTGEEEVGEGRIEVQQLRKTGREQKRIRKGEKERQRERENLDGFYSTRRG